VYATVNTPLAVEDKVVREFPPAPSTANEEFVDATKVIGPAVKAESGVPATVVVLLGMNGP